MADTSPTRLDEPTPPRKLILPTVSAYLRNLDKINAKILAKIHEHGPRNISLIARDLSLPVETVRYRFKKMYRTILTSTQVLINYSKLGLARASVFIDSSPSALGVVERALKAVDYWMYIVRCNDRYNGFYAVYAIPVERLEQFKEYFDQVRKLPCVNEMRMFITDNPHDVVPSLECLDFETLGWKFDWDEWTSCITGEMCSHDDVVGGSDSRCYMDSVDIYMLEKLQEDAETSFVEIAKKLDLTPQDIRYHYQSHLLGRGMITGYYPVLLPYPHEISDLHVFIITFNDERGLRRFAHCCEGKPFVGNYARVKNENTLLMHIYLPKMEFQQFLDALYSLSEQGRIARFCYVRTVLPTFEAYTVRYSNFRNGEWVYDHVQHLSKLESLGKRAMLAIQNPILS